AGDAASELVYTVTAAPTHGTLKLSGGALAVNGTFTQNDVNTGKVTYTHDGREDSHSCGFSVADCAGAAATGTVTITFTEATATITANTGLSVPEGTTATISGSKLAASADASDPANELVYTITAAPTHGTLKLSGVATSTFTQDDVNTGKVTYTHD